MMCRRHWLDWLGAACLGWPLAATAATVELSEQEARNVRQVVQAQLRAMAEGDADKAFFYAAPAIRAQFGNAGRFMAMVLGNYPMVVRPAATVFYRPTQAEGQADGQPLGQVLQVVQLRDRQGQFWRASYVLVRKADGPWRISGCVVVSDSSSSST